MKLKKITRMFLPLLTFCLSAGLSSPVMAAQPVYQNAKNNSHLLQFPIAIKNDLEVRSVETVGLGDKVSIKKYETGTLLSLNLDGTAAVRMNDQEFRIHTGCLAISDKEKDALNKEKERELEERRKIEEAQEKVEQAKTEAELAAAQDNYVETDEEEEIELTVEQAYSWSGSVLSRSAGVNYGPSGKETYYNLPMDGVISIMRSIGNNDEYWVREDGVKMLGNYVMVAAHLQTRPRGSLIPTSLGMGIVCDTGTFALSDHTQLDIAVAW